MQLQTHFAHSHIRKIHMKGTVSVQDFLNPGSKPSVSFPVIKTLVLFCFACPALCRWIKALRRHSFFFFFLSAAAVDHLWPPAAIIRDGRCLVWPSEERTSHFFRNIFSLSSFDFLCFLLYMYVTRRHTKMWTRGQADAEDAANVVVIQSAGDRCPRAYSWNIIAHFSASEDLSEHFGAHFNKLSAASTWEAKYYQ